MARGRATTQPARERARGHAAAKAPRQEQPPSGAASREHVVVITGLSGAGKSQASKLFEDQGYYTVDNLPPELIDEFLTLRDAEPDRYRQVALMLDIRAGDPAPAIQRARAALAERGTRLDVFYLEASDVALVSRFSETRHRHPLQTRAGVQAGIDEERRRLAAARELADHVIDTSSLSIPQLQEKLLSRLPADSVRDTVQVDVVTFGFKHGIPLEADLVFDARFLTNPFYDPDLKPLTGLQAPVRDFVLRQPTASRFLDLVAELLTLTVPAYRAEGKTRLTVALGCTGGHHRSIALAEELAARLRGLEHASISIYHRELER
jgi:UPF0042 nucleotide-binding protein